MKTSRAQPPGRGRLGRTAAAVALSTAVTMAAAALGGPAGAAARTGPSAATRAAAAMAAADPTGLQPIDFVVLVDESGSIGQVTGEMDDERAAAALLTQSEISAASKAAVIGFGSAPAAGDSAVDQVCPLTTLDTTGRQHLSGCVGGLHVRTDQQGNDTDFPNALNQALSTLGQAGDQAPKLIFMLTDGQLDVRQSASWGADADSRQHNAEVALDQTLAAARAQSVQIWPLGFGPQVDPAELDKIAAGAYQTSCVNLPSAVPHKQVVAASKDVNDTLLQAFAGARCAQVDQGASTSFTNPVNLYVNVPPIATDGAIEVTKRDPKAVATFFDPQNRQVPLNQDFDGSHFETSGQDGAVEALRITNPVPGRWRIHLEDPVSYPGQVVSAAAIWQGELRSFITVSPPAPQAGQKVQVRVQLQTRSGVVLAPADLAGITVSASLAGDGFDPMSTPLSADPANSGEFAGELTVPAKATGKLSFTGTVLGQGVTGDQRPFPSQIQAAGQAVLVSATLDSHRVTAGSSLTGRLQVDNSDGAPHVLTLSLTDLAPGAALRIQPTSVKVLSGSSQSYPFTVQVGRGTPTGALAGRLVVTDAATGTSLATTFFDATVTKPPSIVERWWWAMLIAALVLAALAAVVVANQKRTKRNRVLPAAIVLYRDGREVHRLRRQGNGNELYFTVTRAASTNPSLRRLRNGTQYTMRRTDDGQIEVRMPQGTVHRMRGSGRLPLEGDLELAVVDSSTVGPPRQPRQTRQTRQSRTSRDEDVRTASGASVPGSGSSGRTDANIDDF
jgi:hypothetical protein